MNKLLPPVFAVYKNPTDYPNKFVLRRWVGETPDILPLAIEDNYDDVIKFLPENSEQIATMEGDDPCIFETWI